MFNIFEANFFLNNEDQQKERVVPFGQVDVCMNNVWHKMFPSVREFYYESVIRLCQHAKGGSETNVTVTAPE